MSQFNDLRDAMRQAAEGRVLIGHANRAAASWYHLVTIGALPKFNHFFTAVAGGALDIAENMYALEDGQWDQPDLVWGYKPYWQQLDELCERYPNAIVFCTYRKPEHEKLLQRHPGILLSCPPQNVAARMEDKAQFHGILTAAGVEETLTTQIFRDAKNLPSYDTLAAEVGPEFVIQIIASAGGARHDLKSSISFVTNAGEFEAAKKFQAGQGAVRVVTMVRGHEANGAGLSTPWGAVYVDIPSHKPVGLPQLHGRPGAGAGNDWTWPYPSNQVERYRRQVERVGSELSVQGFDGAFGLDVIFGFDGDGPYPHEINGRSQGTTESQDAMDLRAGVPSLPMMAAALDLGVDRDLFPDAGSYNHESLRRLGQWYMKVNVPKHIRVARDLNGVWTVRGDQLVAQHSGSILGLKPNEIYIYGAPQTGQIANPGMGLPNLYVNGINNAVFDEDDQMTDYGRQVWRAVYFGLGFKEGEF